MAGSFSVPGIGSGIDVRALLDAVRDGYNRPAEIKQDQLDSIQRENSSLDRLRELLNGVDSSIGRARSSNGGAASLAATSSNTEVLTATAGSGSQAGSTTVNIQSIAKAGAGSFSTSFASTNEVIGGSGSATFTVGTGDAAESFDVAFGTGTTAEQFVAEFNAQADGRANARLVNVGSDQSPQFQIAFSAATTGTAEGSLAVSGGGSLGVATIEQATDLTFTVSGVNGQFTRSSNTVNDAIGGISFQAKSEGAATIKVAQDTGALASRLEAFVTAFNDARRFSDTESAIRVTDEGPVYGSLARSNVGKDALSALRSAVAGVTSEDGSTSLASLGVTTNRDGSLSFNRQTFDAALTANPSQAVEVVTALADRVSGVGGTVNQFTGYGRTIDAALQTNESNSAALTKEVGRLQELTDRRIEGLEKQFTSLDMLSAKLQSAQSILAGLFA